jgi:uncharacterized protein (TIGR02145 family)
MKKLTVLLTLLNAFYLCISAQQIPISTQGLIAYYPLNGNTTDASGNGRSGTANGVTPVANRFNIPDNAMVFNGENNTLALKGVELHRPEITICAWIKVTDINVDTVFKYTTPGNNTLMLRVVDNDYQVEILFGGIKHIFPNTSGMNAIDPVIQRFDFICISFVDNRIKFIINNSEMGGPAINIMNVDIPYTIKNNPIVIARCILDEIYIFNRDLSREERMKLQYVSPEFTTFSVSQITTNSATIESNLRIFGGHPIYERGIYYDTIPEFDSTSIKIIVDPDSGKIITQLSGLISDKTYFVKSYAKHDDGQPEIDLKFKTLRDWGTAATIRDVDGNLYHTVKIGTQTWMAENLKTTKYADGTAIGNGNIMSHEYGKYYFSYINDTSSNNTYGLYYTWMSATNSEYGRTYSNGIQGACPDGWHIPNYAEQKALINFLGGSQVAGGKLKDTGLGYWNDPNTGATNESGFTALGSGVRRNNYSSGEFSYTGDFTAFWGSESNYYETFEGRFYRSVVLSLSNESQSGGVSMLLSTWACPVRCLKDTSLSYFEIPEIVTIPVFDISGTMATTGGKLIDDGGVLEIKTKGVCWSKSPNPDTTSFKTIDSSKFMKFLYTISGLEPNTRYYVRAYAATPAGVGYGNEFSFVTTPDPLRGSVTDIEGNIYKTITIGNQVWMGENLRTTHLNNGDSIQIITNYDYWSLAGGSSSPDLNAGSAAMGWYQNNSKNYTYGALYNWKVVDSEKVCPLGWHVPTLNEWKQLENYLGGAEIAGGKIKSTGTYFWSSPNTGATNESGFSALPGGFRQGLNGDNALGYVANFWTSTDGYLVNLEYSNSKMTKTRVNNKYGCSVRCIKDSSEIPETFIGKAGDIDSDHQIQSTDASLALQYSVGLDPLPSSDPRPWEAARIAAADVDKQNGITAYDASLILQYEAGLITSFPAGDNKKSFENPQADIDVGLENGFVTFRPQGKLYGFNLKITGSSDILGLPQILHPKVISAYHITSGGYSVGLATAVAPEENVVFMKIPVQKIINEQVTVDMSINNMTKQLILGSPTKVPASTLNNVEIFPNPANTILYFRNISEKAIVSIYNLHGKVMLKKQVDNGQIDISNLEDGTYFIKLKDKKNTVMKKFVKQE